MSAPLSAIMTTSATVAVNVSALHPELLKISTGGAPNIPQQGAPIVPDGLWTSGFYYCKEFLADDPTQCMLDESASNTFANSKNASVGSSGRPKRVTLYRSRSSDQAGSESFEGGQVHGATGGVGFKSANIFDLERDN